MLELEIKRGWKDKDCAYVRKNILSSNYLTRKKMIIRNTCVMYRKHKLDQI